MSSVNNELEEVLPHKETTFIEPNRKQFQSYKCRYKELLLQNRFETLDMKNNLTKNE